MDFSLIFLFLIAVVVAAILTARAATGKVPKNNPRGIAFAASFIAGMLFLRPWATFASDEWRELVAVTFFVVAWTALGTVIGGAVGRKMRRPS